MKNKKKGKLKRKKKRIGVIEKKITERDRERKREHKW